MNENLIFPFYKHTVCCAFVWYLRTPNNKTNPQLQDIWHLNKNYFHMILHDSRQPTKPDKELLGSCEIAQKISFWSPFIVQRFETLLRLMNAFLLQTHFWDLNISHIDQNCICSCCIFEMKFGICTEW